MSSFKGKVVRLLSAVAVKRGAVVESEEVGGFRRLVVRCEVEVPAGSKVQLLLPTDDMRTYTPIPSKGGMGLLGWTRAGGPGAAWMSRARVGDEVAFVGPQRSLEMDPGPVVVVGDETSVAVAAAFASARPGEVHAVLQARSIAEVRAAAVAVGLAGADVVEAGETGAIASAVRAKLAAGASVALTGGAEMVLAVREALRAEGVPRVKTKTYWVPGKTGLD